MFKITLIIIFTFNLLACEPVQLASKKTAEEQEKIFTCLPSQSQCEINSEFGRFNIQFSGQVSQGKIKTELPFQIQIQFDAIDESYKLKTVMSYLEGKDMFMGKIPVFFESDQQKANIMVAESLLASCSEEQMTWRLWVEVEVFKGNKASQQRFFIEFDSQRL